MFRRKHGFVLRHRSVADRIRDGPRHYFRTLSDTLSIRFWLTEAATAIVVAVGLAIANLFIWIAAVVFGTGLVALGFFVATQSFVLDVRGKPRTFKRYGSP